MIDDLPLSELAGAGNLEAFNKVVELYQAAVYNVCLRITGNVQQAEDATQETFFAAYRSIKSFKGGVFRGWLLRIATNQCYDQLRRRKRQPAEPLPDELPVADRDPRPDEAALSGETVSAIEHAIRQLPDDQRACVVLIDVQGLDYEEAAQALNVNLGTVKSRLSRARSRLRELLAPELHARQGE